MSIQPTDSDQAGFNYPPLGVQSTERIAQMARLHLRDLPIGFQCRIICTGTTYRFELPVENVEPSGFMAVETDGTAGNTHDLDPSTYTVDYRSGTVILDRPPTAGMVVVFAGTHYKDFLAGELALYVRVAYLQHTNGEDPAPQLDVWPPVVAPLSGYGVPAPIQLPEIEEYPLSLLVASLALWDLTIEAAQEYDIRTPDGVSIPRGQRFQQLTSLLQLIEGKYEQLCNVLGIGLFKIQMYDLRRVSRTTNRYVPIYRAREFDDLNWAQREEPPRYDYPRVITDKGTWDPTVAYHTDDIVFEGGLRYIALQPSLANDPRVDVNPSTRTGFYWAYTTIGLNNWMGTW